MDRYDYAISHGVYLPADEANRLTITIVSGSAGLYVGDPDGRAHVEDQRLTVATDGAGLDHQLHRFFDQHEVPGHVGMGDRQRSAGRDLAPERLEH